jgi:hydrogenase nickel incorporation protein HypB
MCVVCGCTDAGQTGAEDRAPVPAHDHPPEHGQVPGDRDHGSVHVDPQHGDLDFGAGAARVSIPGMSQQRAIKLEADILGVNNRAARRNRQHFAAHGVTVLNLVSGPGSGKTTLLCATIEALRARAPSLVVSVIEGDQQTSFDADRIRATGAPAIQVNTGKGCHLDAPMVAEAFSRLHHHHHDHRGAGSLLFIENVGNLVCPAIWDLGEDAKVVILSVAEGEDKPLKYPDMFAASTLMLLNKIDLLPHLRFDVQRCIEMARRVNPTIEVIPLSATSGEGMDTWLRWLDDRLAPPPVAAGAALQRVADLEAALVEARRAAGLAPARGPHAQPGGR